MNLDDPPVAVCDSCGRSTWTPDAVGKRCNMPQPVGDSCEGIFRSHSTEVTNYIDKAMYPAEEIPQEAMERPIVHVLSATPDPLGSLAAQMKIYEGKFISDLSDITDDERRHYWKDIFNTTLQSPLEDIDFHFAVDGITRATWDQMVRQRTANFGGESLRFSVKLPLQRVVRKGPMVKGIEAREKTWDTAVEAIEAAYAKLIDLGVPAEDARGLIPMNVLVRGHWKTNLRNLITEIGKRTCTQAQFEWRLLIFDMRRAISEYEHYYERSKGAELLDRGWVSSGWQFQEIAQSPIWQPICFKTGQCMFKAGADRGCTIRDRVERGELDKIEVKEWAMDPTAGWIR